MGDARSTLVARLAAELSASPVAAEARALGDAIRARHGAAVAAVVFYGSCLRRRSAVGIFDFFAIVDDYRSAYASRRLAAANALLPPNVFYLEHENGGRRLRAKYAVISLAQLERACSGRSRRCGVWARFAQPLAAVHLRGPDEREALAAACAEATCTAVSRGLGSEGHAWQEVQSRPFWRQLFRATYAAELRPEPTGASDAIYDEHAPRFDAVLELALAVLTERGGVERGSDPWQCRVRVRKPITRGLGRAGKVLSALQLVKSGLTFGDWLPYALWKLERQSGVRLEASERQRRHPWLFAWPLAVRALRSGALR